MDWIALKHNQLWNEFWSSPEIQAQRQALMDLLLRGTWNEKELERIKGQLKVLDGLPRFVNEMAKAQIIRETKAKFSKATPEELRVAALVAQMPEIV